MGNICNMVMEKAEVNPHRWSMGLLNLNPRLSLFLPSPKETKERESGIEVGF